MAEVAGEVKLLLTVDGTTWSSAIDQAQRQIDKLKGKTTDAARVTRAEMTEARHSIHLLGDEFGLHLPRAVQGFVAKLPGVASAMSAAFNTIAVVAIASAIFEAGKKVVEFIEKTRKAGEEARRATEEFSASRHLANLELAESNARIEEQIAKLEKKPGDGLKVALAEARVEAFKLGQQLQTDVQQAQELIDKKLSASLIEQLGGMAGSQGTLAQLDTYGEKVKEIARIADPAKRTAEMRSFAGETLNHIHEEIEARTELQKLEERMAKAIPGRGEISPAEEKRATELRSRFGTEDQTKVLRGLAVYHDMVQEEYDKADLTQQQMNDQARLKRDEDAKQREQNAKEAADAVKRQTAERMTAMETELANEKAFHVMSLEEERDFWQKRYMAGTQLADPINDLIARRIAPLSQEIFKKQTQDAKEWLGMMASMQREADRMAAVENPFLLDRAQTRAQGEADSARMAALHDQPEMLRRIAAAQEELNASEMVSSGLMDKRTEDIIKQRNVLARLRDELAELQGKQAAIVGMPASLYTPTMNPEVLQNQIMAKTAEVNAAQQTLTYQMERDTFGGDMRNMFMDWIKRAGDVREAMTSIFDQSISSINNAIVKTMIDPYHRGDWKAAGRSIFGSVASMGLNVAEASVAKAIGINKLGTQGNPMWVRDAGLLPGTVSSRAASLVNSAGNAVAGGNPGAAVGSILGTMLSFAGYMQHGGTLGTGMAAIVGEQGPELFIPSGSGRIVPNDQWGGTSHTWNIDARGSSDPAAVRFAVQRAISEAAPRIAAGSIAAAKDMESRKPTMSR